jgi:lysophospholipase L1-like esterase
MNGKRRFVTALAVAAVLCGVAVPRTSAQAITIQQTLVVGDSITADWADEPVRAGFPSQQACTIRLHLAAAMAHNHGIKRVIIEAGTNDIIQGPGGGFDCDLPLQDPVTTIVDMVKTAKIAGMQVFVLSVLPIGWDNRAGQPCDPLVPPFNASLKTAILAGGAYWVDDYDPFVGHQAEYQPDGVHPNEAGYKVMEQAYFSAVCSDTGQC